LSGIVRLIAIKGDPLAHLNKSWSAVAFAECVPCERDRQNSRSGKNATSNNEIAWRMKLEQK
jgi:hypothetical protein